MAKRNNHYERAFEAWLRQHKLPYMAVDEQKRSLLGNASLKNLDFIVSPGLGFNWLVDVKGRQFGASQPGKAGGYWKNWTTREDVRGLFAWEALLGPGFGGLLAFIYQVAGNRSPVPETELFHFEGRRYAFTAISVAEYAREVRLISPKWDTVAMPGGRFQELATSLSRFFGLADVDPIPALPW